MATAEAHSDGASGALAGFKDTVPRIAMRLLGLAFVDAFALWLLVQMFRDGVWIVGIAIAIIVVGINIVYLWEDLYPIRWMSPGLALLGLMVIFPVLFTVYTAFTNYSDGHLLTKQQTINLITGRSSYLPEGATTYSWTAFRTPGGEFALVLVSPDGETLLAEPGEPAQEIAPSDPGIGEFDEQGIPTSIEGSQRLERRDTIQYLSQLQNIRFGEEPNPFRINSLDAAARYQPRYTYDESRDAIIDQQTDTVYTANPETGFFVSDEGERLSPGYRVVVGGANFTRILTSPALRGPLVRVFIWTFVFAGLSVITTFALGLFFSLIYDTDFLGRKLVRSLLIIPYTIPAVITILMWRGLLNQQLGVITTTLRDVIGWSPAWFTSPWWAKVAILLVNLWLGYPYMMLICSGALQAISEDVYEAAQVDGASRWQQFWNITLPLLLISTGPLLVSSFAFNFNNFNIIFLYNEGGPPIPGSPVPAGHTDILISYTFRQAFGGGRGADYGYAAAITILIFLLVAGITLVQFRYTNMLEEVSENV